MHAYSALLDSLLGADRNELPNSANAKKRSFADPEICKYYLVAFCPHDLFPNTKSHLGQCPRVHDEYIKEAYEKSPDKDRYAPEFEEEMLVFLKQLIAQAEQKIDKANRRIDAPLPENALLTEEQQKLINSMNDKITKLLQEAELAGDRGDVEEASSLSRQVQTLKREIERAGSLVYGSYMQREKSLRVCAICGAMQSVGDSMSRFESHVTGKMHLGYEKIRACLEELLKRKAEREEASSVEDHGNRMSRRNSSNENCRFTDRRPISGGGPPSYRGGGGGGAQQYPSAPYRRRSESNSDANGLQPPPPPPRRSYGRDYQPYTRPGEERRGYREAYHRGDREPPSSAHHGSAPPRDYRKGDYDSNTSSASGRKSHWRYEAPSPTREEGEAVEEGEYLPPSR